ncbi:hypothetical protein jhhlp_006821 [Lomentospora prolificans]|uniref:Uncharacterized protein n=1 Tax=Lomentospora prolificans TaxID=41688 RepID=A0A2N3N2U9_9PEZI|nr:hypothetical protein jhhlp_006821 [Lomentospora prolificans]
MGGSSSSPAPPPRVARLEQVSLAGVLEPVKSTIRTMDLPPAITETAVEGIRLCAGLRRHYIFSTGNDVDDSMIATTLEMLTGLIAKAKEACNIRDYVTLLIEDTVLRLSMDLGPPTKALKDVARFINPFLNSDGASTTSPIEPFRVTDVALITETEKDLLVLLYYCHESNIKGSPDEAIGHLCKLANKYGDIKDLDVRKEPFTETEVYLFWALIFLVTNISTAVPESDLAKDSRTRLEAEQGVQLSRLLTVVEILLTDMRLDQACFCLMFLRRLSVDEKRSWWKSRAKKIAKELTKRRTVRQRWHEEFAAKTVKEMVKAPAAEGSESWSARSSLSFSREDLGLDPDPMKGL